MPVSDWSSVFIKAVFESSFRFTSVGLRTVCFNVDNVSCK